MIVRATSKRRLTDFDTALGSSVMDAGRELGENWFSVGSKKPQEYDVRAHPCSPSACRVAPRTEGRREGRGALAELTWSCGRCIPPVTEGPLQRGRGRKEGSRKSRGRKTWSLLLWPIITRFERISDFLLVVDHHCFSEDTKLST